MNILITGGAGFIGVNLALKLIKRGHHITILDNLSAQIHGNDPENNSHLYLSIKDKVVFIRGTVTSRKDWLKSIKGQDVIVHFAAETGTGQSMHKIHKYVNVNVSGTAILLDILANHSHQVKKIILGSSRAVYGEGKYKSTEFGYVYPLKRAINYLDNKDFEVKYPGCFTLELVPTDESSKIHPTSLYGITKHHQEQMIMTICPNLNIAPVVFRYQNVYGPGQSLNNPYTGILSIFSNQIKNGSIINIFEDGKMKRDFVFIDDVVDATILGIESKDADGEILNVGYGVPIDILHVAENLIKHYSEHVPININGNYRIGDIRHNYADISKIRTILNYQPKINFEEGLRIFAEWVDTQEIRKDNFFNSIKELKKKGIYR
jgi:dTDP-L-rhamnose 4-epimerase